MSHTFNVEMVEEHEDGSATFTVSGDKASMQALFEAFFTQAVINGRTDGKFAGELAVAPGRNQFGRICRHE